MHHPRYIVYDSPRQFRCFEKLADALDWCTRAGGVIYEPLGMTTAEKVCAETDEMTPQEKADEAKRD